MDKVDMKNLIISIENMISPYLQPIDFEQNALTVNFVVQPTQPIKYISLNMNILYNETNYIWQENNLQYGFYGSQHPDICEWLIHECNWEYDCYSFIDDENKRKTYLKFGEHQGSVEFKLRFYSQ